MSLETMRADGLLIDVRADSRERLLHVAMHLFARHGIDAVSLKAISDAAGNRNKSAVGYHFASKQGLVHAVLERLEEDLGPAIDAQLTAFERMIARKTPPGIDEVVLGLLTPLMQLYAGIRYGRDSIKVMARLIHEPISEFPDELRQSVRRQCDRAVVLLQRLLPNRPKADVELYFLHTLMASVSGLSTLPQYLESQQGSLSRLPLEDIFLSYAGYVAAGMLGRPLVLEPAVERAWRTSLISSQD